MEMPKPSTEHKNLQRLVGRWKGDEKLYPSPWDPKGGMATGRVENKSALDGFIVVQDYSQERGGAPTFRGHGVFSYDPNQKCYLMHWFDSMGAPVNEFKGTFEGKILSLSSKGMMGINRASFDLSRDNSYTFTMEISQDGKQWVPFMEGSYSREGANNSRHGAAGAVE